MIIDFNLHTGSWQDRFSEFSAGDLLDQMQHCGIDKAVVSDLGTAFEDDIRDHLGAIKDDRLIRFRSINPRFDLEMLKSDRSLKGIRIYPTYQEWDFMSSKWAELMLEAGRSNWVVQVYLRLLDPRALQQKVESVSVVQSLTEVVKKYSNIHFVISGANLSEIQGNPGLFLCHNVWSDLSHVQHPIHSVRKLLDVLGRTKLVFGTNTPFFYPYAGVFRMQNAEIEDKDQQAILEDNARYLFGDRRY